MTTTADLPPRIDVFYVGDWHDEPLTTPRSDERVAAELQRQQREFAQAAAREAELIMDLAARRPASADPAPGTPGAR